MDINFITWNVNGLKQNRDQKFQELQNADVVFLQETHIGVGDEQIEDYKKEWNIFYTKYTSTSKGTAILVRKSLDFEYISDERDNRGRYVVLKCKLEGRPYTLVSVYNHQTDEKTLDNLSRYLQSMTTGLLVIGGDFNTILNPFIDKKCNTSKTANNRNHKKLLLIVEKFMKSLQLADVWRRKNPVKQDFTFYRKDSPVSRLDYFFVPEECMWRVRSCEIRNSERPDHQPVALEINNVSTMPIMKDLPVQSFYELLKYKNELLTDETGSSQAEKSSHVVSEVDILSAVHSLQVSDTPRPDGIPISFYKEKIEDLIPYIKTLYDRIHRGAFNCSEKQFNETVKSPHDDSQHFFNVDYLIIATILARRLDDLVESQSKGQVPKHSATVMIAPKTFSTEMRLSCIKDEIDKQKRSNPVLYQDFLIVKNLLRDAPEVIESTTFSTERDKLLDQGCPLTTVLITLALKCFASAIAGDFKQHEILVFKESVILCIQPENLEELTAAVRNRANEVFYIKDLCSGNVSKQLKLTRYENGKGLEAETLMNNTQSEASWSKLNYIHRESRVYEELDFETDDEEEFSVVGDERQTMYAVVTLQDSDEVMVVSSNWLSLDKTQCYWPPFKSTEKCTEAVQNRIKPETGGKQWEKLKVIFHRENVTFEKAIEGQKDIIEQKERQYLGFPGIKRQRLENIQGTSSNQLLPLPSVTSTSTPKKSADDKDETLKMLTDIKRLVQQNSAMLKKLMKDSAVTEAPSSSNSVPPKKINMKTNVQLPLKSFDDVERIQRELQKPKTRSKYVKYLSDLGGFGSKDVIKNIMQSVLTDDLAKEFNWQGRRDKRPFSQLILADVIRDAAFKRSVIRVDCENEIKKYLSYTADRLARKRPRQEGGPGTETLDVFSPTPMDDESEINWDIFD